jgi:CBS domain-containing protein
MQASVAIDMRTTVLEGSGSGWVTSVGLTNLTDAQIDLGVPTVGGNKACDPSLDNEAKLPANEHRVFKVSIPAACEIEDKKVFTISVQMKPPDTAKPIAFEVTAEAKPTKTPEWEALYAFAVAFLVLLVAAALFVWKKMKQRIDAPLKYLGATYSFKDSWVSNVTVAAGLLTGIFGSSDVVDALLGEDTKGAVALATVGAAIAVALIGAAPLILETTKVKNAVIGEKDFFSLGGMVLASVVALAAAFGELWVVYRSGRHLDLGGMEDKLIFVALAGIVLLAVYAIRVLPRMLEIGLTKPPSPKPSDTMKGARMIVKQLKENAEVGVDPRILDETVRKAAEREEESPAPAPAVFAEAPPSAML